MKKCMQDSINASDISRTTATISTLPGIHAVGNIKQYGNK